MQRFNVIRDVLTFLRRAVKSRIVCS